MTNFEETIAAISTAPGTGAIAVVRMSGSNSFEIAENLFRRRWQGASEAEPRLHHQQAIHGYIVDPSSGDHIDEVVITSFKAPHTYTGEDLVEISCHGGQVVTAEILSLLLRSGARLAHPGEFTQRAFLSGRIDLTQAEAVLDVIQAKTSRQGRRALSALSGNLGERINKVRDALIVILTRIVAGIDFPEEIGDAPEPEVEKVIAASLEELQELSKTAVTGRYLRQGLRISIVGKPNAGKSSLLNQLLKYERAIVTDIPGTTRDSLEELLDLNGIPVVLIDTAGIRPTADHVEAIGIERSKKAVAECDLVLFVLDAVDGWTDAEQDIRDVIAEKPFVLLFNKIDLLAERRRASMENRQLNHGVGEDKARANCVARLVISARTGEHLDELTKAIEDFVFRDPSAREGPSLNARQADLCLKACAALKLVLDTLSAGYPQDCLATDLKSAVDALSEISGQSVSEEVITQVFATFCIGK